MQTATERPLQLFSVHLKPLAVPERYDDGLTVRVQLDQPLWSVESSKGSFSADMMSYCIQLDTMIATQQSINTVNVSSSYTGKKTVTFEHGFTSRVMDVLDKMAELLARRDISMTIEEYLYSTGLSRVFPRVSEYLRNPSASIDTPPPSSSPDEEGYFSRVMALNNLLVLAQQLQTNVQTSVSHKYIAHQLALLYQCVSVFGEPLLNHKKSIESHFGELKTICASSGTPRLTPELRKWLTGLTGDLIELSTSFTQEFTNQLLPLTDLIVNKLAPSQTT